MKKIISFLILSVLALYCAASYSEQINIYVLNTGDTHESSKNLGQIKSYVETMRTNHSGRVILLDAGDMLTQFPFPTRISTEDKEARDLASTTPKGEKNDGMGINNEL